MDNRKLKRGCFGGIIGLIGGLMLVSSPPIQAATDTATLTQTPTVALPAQPYYLVTNGHRYNLRDDHQNVQLTMGPSLKAYRSTTWLVTAQTDVLTASGQQTRYYQAKNARDGQQMWLAANELKPGRHYQADAIQTKKAKKYIRAKKGKLYQMTGKLAAMRLVHGQTLSTKQTYRATKQRLYYRHGTAYRYYYVTSKHGVKGWVWHKYLKAGSYYDVAKQQAATKKKLQTYLNSVTKNRTAAVAFYNLAPQKGSAAAKAKHAAIYAPGKLAVNAHGNQVTTSASTYKLYIAAYLMHLKQQHKFTWTKANTTGMHNMIV